MLDIFRWTLLKAWLAALLLAPLICIASPSAQPGSATIEYCADAQAPANIEAAIGCQYTARDALTLKAFFQPTKWVRIQFDPQPVRGVGWVTQAIRVAPHFVPILTLYSSHDRGKTWDEMTTGGQFPVSNPHNIIGGYIFFVTPTPQNHVFYLKVASYPAGFLSINTASWPAQGLQSQVGLGIHLGFLLLILGFSYVSYVIDRNPLMGRLSLLIGSTVLGVLAGSGILAYYLFPTWPQIDDVLLTLTSCVRLALWVWLMQGFLIGSTPPPWYIRACRLSYASALLALLMAALQLNAFIPPLLVCGTLLISIVQVLAIIRTPDLQGNLRHLLVAGFILSSLSVLLATASLLMPLLSDDLPLYMTRLADLVPSVVVAGLILIQARRVNEHLMETRNELVAVNIRRDMERKKLEDRQMLLDMLMHELKNPLASISIASGSLTSNMDKSDATNLRRLKNIQMSIENMDTVIERCSTVHQLESSELVASKAKVSIQALLEDLIDSHLARDRVRLQPSTVAEIVSDGTLLKIVFANLLDNALKYSSTNTLISISVSQFDQSVRISMTNAVSPTLRPDPESLFSRFYRHPDAHYITGTGLGLFLVRSLCERLGGSVHAELLTGEISFHVHLPV